MTAYLHSRTIVTSHFIRRSLFKAQLVDALYRQHQKLDAIALQNTFFLDAAAELSESIAEPVHQ